MYLLAVVKTQPRGEKMAMTWFSGDVDTLITNFKAISGISKYWCGEFEVAVLAGDLEDAEHIANSQADNNNKINYHDKEWLKGINWNDYR